MEIFSVNLHTQSDYGKIRNRNTDHAVQEPTFTITDTKPYVPVVATSTQDNTKLLEQLKSGFKRTINLSKYK